MTSDFKDSAIAGPWLRRMRRGMSVRALGLVLVLLVAMPLLLAMGLMWRVEKDHLLQRLDQNLQTIGALTAAQQQQLVEGTRQTLLAISVAPVVQARDWPACGQFLRQLGSKLPAYVSVGVLDLSGRLVCRSTSTTSEVQLGDRDYFRAVLATRRFAVGALNEGRVTGNRNIPFAQPVLDADNQLVAIAFLGLNLAAMDARLGAVGFAPGVSSAVTDWRGTVVAASGGSNEVLGQPFSNPAALQAIQARRSGRVEAAPDAPVQHAVRSIEPAGGQGMFVVTQADIDAIAAPSVRRFVQRLAWMLAMVAALIALVVTLGARWLVLPMLHMVESMRQIGAGAYRAPRASGRVFVRELQTLRRGLGLMADSLERRRVQRDAAVAQTLGAREEMVSVINRMDDGFMVLDEHWRIRLANRSAAEILRCLPGALEGLDFWSCFPGEDRNELREVADSRIRANKSWKVEDFHSELGRWLELRVYPAPSGIGVFLRDISERWAMIEKLRDRDRRTRELFASNPSPMCIYDVDTLGFLAVNEAAARLYGRAPEEWTEMTVLDITPAEDQSMVRAHIAAQGHRGSLNDEGRIWRHLRKDGSVMLVEVSSHAFVFKERVARLVKLQDVTERLLSESRLRQDRQALEVQLTQLTQSMALARDALNAGTRFVSRELPRRIDKIRRESGSEANPAAIMRLEGLAAGMDKLFSVVRKARHLESLDMRALAVPVVAALRERYPGRQVALEIESGLFCNADRAMLTLLLDALLDNAWKFTGGRPEAWVKLGRSTIPGHSDVFCVSDNGRGFDAATQMPGFKAFERLHRAPGFDGDGLGLAIAAAVVHRHGGRIWMDAETGRGATVFFTLGVAVFEAGHLVQEVVIDSMEDPESAPAALDSGSIGLQFPPAGGF